MATFSSRLANLGRRLGINLLFMAALAAAVAPFTLLLPPALATGLGILFWIGASFWAIKRFGHYIDGWSILCAVVPMIMVGIGFYDFVSLAAGGRVIGISVAQAPQHAAGRAFTFTDALVQRNMGTFYQTTVHNRKTGRVSRHYYNVAPLTAGDWHRKQPVPAWIGCSDRFSTTCADWRKSCRSAIAVDELDRRDLRKAADLAVSRFSLTEAPGAPLLKCVSSLDEGFDARLRQLWLALVAVYFFWMIPMFLYRAWHALAAAWAASRDSSRR